jgi:hypothetical protein
MVQTIRAAELCVRYGMARNNRDRRTQLQSLRSDYDGAFAYLTDETHRLQTLSADVDPAAVLEAESRVAQAEVSYRARRDTLARTLMKLNAGELSSADAKKGTCVINRDHCTSARSTRS